MFNAAKFPNLVVVDHPIVQHKVTMLRDRGSDSIKFRAVLEELGMVMGIWATDNLSLHDMEIVNLHGQPMTGKIIIDSDIVVLPILRTGLVLSNGIEKIIPMARFGHLGIYHDYEEKSVNKYLVSMPAISEGTRFLVLDGILGTSGSISEAVETIVEFGGQRQNITAIVVTAHVKGIETFYSNNRNKDVRLITAAIENGYNDQENPFSSLGNPANRSFWTE